MSHHPEPPDPLDTDAALLRRHLAMHSEPCPSCGYDLRQLEGSVCPECGQPLRLRVELQRPNLAAFVVGLIGLSSGAGFCGLLLVWALYFGLTRAGGFEPVALLFAIAIEFLVISAIIVLWVWRSGWIRRQRAARRWTLAACCWLVPVVVLLVLALMAP